MGKYIIDTYQVTLLSEARFGPTDAGAQIHVIDLLPNSFDDGTGKRRPYIPAESLHGRWRSTLDRILGHTEATWKTAAETSDLFGNADLKQRGRLRFSHAYLLDPEPRLALYRRIKLDPLLGTAADTGLFDELMLCEGAKFVFTRILRAADLDDTEICEQLALLDLVDQAFAKRLVTIGAGSALGRGQANVERLHRVEMAASPARPAVQAWKPPQDLRQFVPAAATGGLAEVPPFDGRDDEPSVLAVRLTNLGQLWTGRELVTGTTLFGALAAIALELDGSSPRVRINSAPPLVAPDPSISLTRALQATPGGLFARLYAAWKSGTFRIAPLLPVPRGQRIPEGDPVVAYNTLAQTAYSQGNGYRYYDGQIIHQKAPISRDTGTVHSGYHVDVETCPLQQLFGFVLLKNSEARALFVDLLPWLAVADLGHSKHTVCDVAFPAHVAAKGNAPGLAGQPHLLTRRIDGYLTPEQNAPLQYMTLRWTGCFPCSSQGALASKPGGPSHFQVASGWAIPQRIQGAETEYDGNCVAVSGVPAHGQPGAVGDARSALLHGLGALPEWRALGYGQVVFLG